MGSDAERTSEFSNGVAFANSNIINTWKPYLNRAVSDFDTTHLITVNYVYQLSFGRGRSHLNSGSTLMDALIGGWQNTGILRNTSGLPLSVADHGSAILFTHSGIAEPTQVYVAAGGQILRDVEAVTALNPLFAERAKPEWQPFAWKSEDGTAVGGVLIYPPGKKMRSIFAC